MALDAQVQLLTSGAEQWNLWRQAHPTEKIDLSGAEFMNAWLPSVDLKGADLSHSNFHGAHLSGARLDRADLNNAFWSQVNLQQASLQDANLFKTCLHYADLTSADLSRAAATEANLQSANLKAARLDDVNLNRGQLTYAQAGGASFRRATLFEALIQHADFADALFVDADLSSAIMTETNFSKADFTGLRMWAGRFERARAPGAIFKNAVLNKSDFTAADVSDADFCNAEMNGMLLFLTDFTRANLSSADVSRSTMIQTRFNDANLSGVRVYGISTWDVSLDNARQNSLIITGPVEATITIDELELAQFTYLLLNRQKLRQVIDTITSKAVLILGRFTPERKAVLDAMANELRHLNLLPIIFDFERASNRDFTEAIRTLAGMSLFVIADITNPKSAPLELQAILPDYQIPFVPVIQEGEAPFSMFANLTKYDWVLPLLVYPSKDALIQVFKKAVVDEAYEMHKKIRHVKAAEMQTRSVDAYLQS